MDRSELEKPLGDAELAAIISLGCSKNLVDSELMAAQLARSGYELTDETTEASLILVNTCGFLESAVEEAIETILGQAKLKTHGACKILAVTGCMVQRYGVKLLKLLPEVDLFLGTSHYLALQKALLEYQGNGTKRLWIGRPGPLPDRLPTRLVSAPAFSTYLKVAEGCSNRCAYCMIPHLRGPYRSRSVIDLVREANVLVAGGARELNLIAQDTTALGLDRGEKDALVALLDSLERLEGLRWIRILYAYPDRIDERLLSAMRSSRKVVPYLDMPIQHCVPRILDAMGRRGTAASLKDRIDLIRSYLPDVALRTSLMVGFPGETEVDFERLVDFVADIRFDHVGVFAFSAESGARAARFTEQLPQEVKESRRQALLELQKEISRERLRRFVGKEIEVLVEGFHPESEMLLRARTVYQAPDVDGHVIITSGNSAIGELEKAYVTEAHDYDLVATLLPGE